MVASRRIKIVLTSPVSVNTAVIMLYNVMERVRKTQNCPRDIRISAGPKTCKIGRSTVDTAANTTTTQPPTLETRGGKLSFARWNQGYTYRIYILQVYTGLGLVTDYNLYVHISQRSRQPAHPRQCVYIICMQMVQYYIVLKHRRTTEIII